MKHLELTNIQLRPCVLEVLQKHKTLVSLKLIKVGQILEDPDDSDDGADLWTFASSSDFVLGWLKTNTTLTSVSLVGDYASRAGNMSKMAEMLSVNNTLSCLEIIGITFSQTPHCIYTDQIDFGKRLVLWGSSCTVSFVRRT